MIIAKKILKITCIVLGVILAAAIIFVGVLTITEYKPDDSESLEVTSGSTFGKNTTGSAKLSPSVGDSISIVTWNLGYGSLGANADFFMDGGDSVYTSTAKQVNDNMEAITSELNSLAADIFLLQEVDERSSRSHKINEADILREKLPSYTSSYAYNYKTLMVPYPLPPIGRVTSGIMTLSSFEVSDAERIQLPCPFSYPIRLCNLKRCLIVSRIPIAGSEHELVIVNLHLEAYDMRTDPHLKSTSWRRKMLEAYDSGEGKAAQTRMLADILQNEAAAGNYVIAGGDFNQTFSNVDLSAYPQQSADLWAPGSIDVSEFGDSFTCSTDSSAPTCRSLDKPYEGSDHESFQYYVIDGFIVSSNLQINSTETIDLDFKNSDHNPIRLDVALK